MKETVKLALTILLTLGAVLIVTVAWIAMLLARASKARNSPPGQSVGIDVLSLMTLHHAPFYWLTVLLVIVLAGMVYWRWA